MRRVLVLGRGLAAFALGPAGPECALGFGTQLARADRCEESVEMIQIGREMASGPWVVPRWDRAIREATEALAACESRTGR